jgi:antirestriction protein
MSSNATPKTAVTPRIYVACLAAYNNGVLYGRWIDIDQDADDIHAEIQAMLAASPEPGAEEWRIDDFDGLGSYRLSEYESIENVAAIGKLIAEHGTLAGEVLTHVSGVDEAREMLDEQYQGAFDSLTAWAEQLMDDTGQLNALPENLRNYFDYEAFARDAELGGDIVAIETSDGLTHVFWSR